jgi:CBS domain-containing protein
LADRGERRPIFVSQFRRCDAPQTKQRNACFGFVAQPRVYQPAGTKSRIETYPHQDQLKEATMPGEISTATSVGELATRKPTCIDRDTTILGASELMRCCQVDELVVTERPEGVLVPVGIVSARDIVTRIIATGLDPAVVTAGDITWSDSTHANATDSVSETLELLHATGNSVLPVIDGDGCLTGVVSLDELLWALAESRSQ